MKITVLTIFPEMFSAVTESGVLRRAIENGILCVEPVNIREYTLDKHKRVDDTPFGGGVGMVMTPEPVFRAMETLNVPGAKAIYMSPRGNILDYEKIQALSREDELILLCGRYEGVDQRILDYWNMEEISIGDYILTGGELPAMVLIDAVSRMIPGVLGESLSIQQESVYSGLLEYPQYTKPREYQQMNVPEVLVNGNHELIRLWQFEQSLRLTRERRPELLESYLKNSGEMSKKEKEIVKKIMESSSTRG